jgi:hypothetical protein
MKTKYFWIGEYKKLNFAVLTKYDTFDTIQKKGHQTNYCWINEYWYLSVKSKLKTKTSEVEHWLNKQKWYSHDSGIHT